MPFRNIEEDLKEQAQIWKEAIDSENKLIRDDKDLLIAWLWNMNHNKEEGYPPVVNEFVNASREAAGGAAWHDALLRQKKTCSVCRETYRIENLSICPVCQDYYCYRCQANYCCNQPFLG